MNIRDLEYFHQLSHLHSFTAVAQECQVSQPTITYAVKRLEEQLSCHLFVKDPSHRNVILTDQGKILAKHASSIIAELTVLDKEIKRSLEPKIKVGFPPIIRAKILSNLIEKDKDLSFLTTMDLETMGSLELLDLLVSGDLDFSLLGSLYPLAHPKLVVKELYQLPFEFLLSEDHPLAHHKELSFKDVLNEHFILLGEGHVHMEAFHRLNESYHEQAKPFLELNEVATIAQLVAKNVGISLVTDDTLFDTKEGLVKVPLVAQERLYFHVSYAYTKTTVLPPLIEQFMALLENMR